MGNSLWLGNENKISDHEHKVKILLDAITSQRSSSSKSFVNGG